MPAIAVAPPPARAARRGSRRPATVPQAPGSPAPSERRRSRRNSSPSDGSTAKYKTELCNCYAELGFCDYGPRCQFAHGTHELKTRTGSGEARPCVDFVLTGFCSYGRRCNYSHRLPDGVLVDSSDPSLPRLEEFPSPSASADSSPLSSPKSFSRGSYSRGAAFADASLSALYHGHLVQLGERPRTPGGPLLSAQCSLDASPRALQECE